MLTLVRALRKNRRLVKDFVVRDLKARYVGSSMGFFWSVVFPILNLFVYMFVFRLILKARWSDSQGPMEVALVMLAGIVVWTTFAETISRSTNTLVDNSNLIQKVVFPAEILPAYLTISSLINMCIGLPVVILCVLWFGYLSPPEVFVDLPSHQVENDQGKLVWQRDESPLGEDHQSYAVRVRLTRGWRQDVIVPFELGGTAVEGEDYLLQAREVVIPAGHLGALIWITPLRDRLQEGHESIEISLLQPDTAKLVERGSAGKFASRRFRIQLIDGPLLGPKETAPSSALATSVPVKVKKDYEPPYHPLALGASLICLPLLFLLQALFTVGLGYFLSAINLFVRDTFHLVGVGITVWMFGTPIFYPGSLVQQAGYGIMLQLNPMHWLIDSYRAVLLYAQWPDPLLLLQLAGAGILVFLLGGAFFSAHKAKFPDLL